MSLFRPWGTSRLSVAALLASVALLLAVGTWFFVHQQQAFRREIETELAAVARVRATQLSEWRDDQIEDAGHLVANPFFFDSCSAALQGPSATSDDIVRARLLQRQNEHDYSDALFVDVNGAIIASTNHVRLGHDAHSSAVAEALRLRRVVFVDVHQDVDMARPAHVAIVAPLVDPRTSTGTSAPIGALVLINDTTAFLDSVLTTWPTASETAETYLVRVDGGDLVVLSTLRHRQGPPMDTRLPLTGKEVSAVAAVTTRASAMLEGVDYRGVDVLTVAEPVRGTAWFVIAEIDAEEAYAPWRFHSSLLFAVLGGLLATMTAGFMLLAQHQRSVYYRALFESAPEAIFVQTEGRFASVNPACCRLLGEERAEDVLGTAVIERFAPEHRDQVRERIRTVNQDRKAVEAIEEVIVSRGGERIPVLVSAVPFTFRRRHGALVFMRDMRAFKRAEAERTRLLVAIDQLEESIVITDASGVISYVNRGFEHVTGYAREEALRRNLAMVHGLEQNAEALGGIESALGDRRTWHGRITGRRKDNKLFTADMTISPVQHEPDEPLVHVAVLRDVTEEVRLQAQFQQAQKMESVGRLAGGIAHDFNNVLGVIMGHAELALLHRNPDERLRSDLEDILSAAERAARITRQLLAFARKQTIAPQVLDVNDTIESMLKMLRRLIGEDIDLLWKPGHGLWRVKMDPSQVDQILANLCVNARDAIEGTGKVTIETGNAVFDDAYCADHVGFVPGEYVLLAVSDDGVGMTKETLAVIFEPFFTTKERDRGTGLGLPTVYGIVKQNGGFINVYSEPGKGSTFKIYLARDKSRAEPAARRARGEAARGHGETILIVEDEPAVLRFASRALETLGYRVLAASTPGDALHLTQQNAGRIDLLLTDVVMPEQNGRDLAERLRPLAPAMKTLFMSGYTTNVIAHRGVLDEGVHFLPKPFSLEDLARKVREALG